MLEPFAGIRPAFRDRLTAPSITSISDFARSRRGYYAASEALHAKDIERVVIRPRKASERLMTGHVSYDDADRTSMRRHKEQRTFTYRYRPRSDAERLAPTRL